MNILLVVYDNDSYIHWFPQGLAYIATALKNAGHKISVHSMDWQHLPVESITERLDNEKFDAVAVSVIGGYYQYAVLLKISDAINNSRQRPFYMLGGHGPAPEPEYFINLAGADAICIGEGERTVVELMEAVESGGGLTGVNGIAWKDGEQVVVNEPRELIKDVDNIPFPAYEMFPMEYYRLIRMPYIKNSEFVLPLLSGRGCPFRCNFCYRMDKGLRIRSNESIIDEIEYLKKKYNIKHISFSDELLMSSEKRTISLCQAFLDADLNIKWDCNGRLNFAKRDVLKMMKKAGCVFINYGIEAMDNDVLKRMNKNLTLDQIYSGIEATLEEGVSPGFNIIFGHIGDTKESLEAGVEFLLKHDDGAQLRTIRPVTPYPGSDLYYDAIKMGLLKDCADFYENKHLNSDLLAVNFTNMSDEEYNECLFNANKRLLLNYYERLKERNVQMAHDLYFKANASFRGFRQS